jgi:hypothetical protein
VADNIGLSCYFHPSRVERIEALSRNVVSSQDASDSTTEDDIHNEVMENCKLFMEQSKPERKAIGRKSLIARRVLKIKNDKKRKNVKSVRTQTEGIDGLELERRKAAPDCQHCAWPRDRKGSQKTFDCFRWKKIREGNSTCLQEIQ